jgi:nicotinamide-nucleotide amidase
MDSATLTPLAARALALLAAHGWTLATAESCTGGLLGHLLTEVPGSSATYVGGIIAYANAVKIARLGVPPAVLDSVGAVSPETARAMALGAIMQCGASVGLSTTGIAGPGGGSPEKPVGLVYLGLATPAGAAVERHLWDGTRSANKLLSAERALRWLIETLEACP